MKQTGSLTTALCLVLLLASGLPAPAGGRAVREIASLDLEDAALQLPLGGTLRLEGLQLETKSTPATAELERFRVFAPDAQIVLHGADGDTYLPVPRNAYFRGQIVGDPGSRVVFSVLEAGGARGLITRRGRIWIMGNAKGAKAASYALSVREIAPRELAGRSFSCDTDLLPPPPAQLPLTAAEPVPGNKAVTTSYTARVAYETDREYLDLFGGNATRATNYIGDLTAHASTIYGTEVNTTWQVVSVSLWRTPDPWSQQNRKSCLLYEFGRYWNQRNPMPGTPMRTVAHMLNGTDVNGGLAWLNGLCTHGWSMDISADGCSLSPAVDNYGGSYSLSGGISGDFNINDPQTVWDIQVLVHEVGHNFNSPHTHCYGNIGGSPDPIDPCSKEECGHPGCWCGTPNLPSGCPGEGQGCGTIMSYCSGLPGDLDNVTLTLGAPVGGHPYGVMPERVPTLQRAYVEAQAAAYYGCFDLAGICSPDPYTACLLDGRFRVEGRMNDFSSPPREFLNRVMSFPGIRAESDQAVFFQSFNAGNFEVGVKMVDACGLPEDHPLRAYWAFFGGLTNAETWIEIEDTVTRDVYMWFNPAGNFPHTLGDSGAFPCLQGAPAEPCVRDSSTACLIGGRFKVSGTMLDFSDPPGEFPVAVMDFPSGRAESEQAVFFESFSPGNFEIGVKMVDGCGFPEGHPLRFFWVFYGGLTNAQAEVRVTQISTGLVDVWSNPAGVFPRAEGRTSAFPCD